MDIIFEILIEVYMELMLLIIPQDKRSKKHYYFAASIAIILTLCIIALGVWGIVLITDYANAWGWLPLSLAILFSLAQIGFGILLYIRRSKRK